MLTAVTPALCDVGNQISSGSCTSDVYVSCLELEVKELKGEVDELCQKLLASAAAAAKLEGQLFSQAAVEANQKETISFLKEWINKK